MSKHLPSVGNTCAGSYAVSVTNGLPNPLPAFDIDGAREFGLKRLGALGVCGYRDAGHTTASRPRHLAVPEGSSSGPSSPVRPTGTNHIGSFA